MALTWLSRGSNRMSLDRDTGEMAMDSDSTYGARRRRVRYGHATNDMEVYTLVRLASLVYPHLTHILQSLVTSVSTELCGELMMISITLG